MPPHEELRVKLIAIAGPSGSGKTYLANRLSNRLGRSNCVVISQDNYYKDWSYLPKQERININFDDAQSFDFKLLTKHIKMLKSNKTISMPIYSFTDNCRLIKTKKVYPKPYVIVEGLMPYIRNDLRKLFDLKIYTEIDTIIGLARRIKRDIAKRGETVESVCIRYFNDVLPMQNRYVEPFKKYADVIIPNKSASKVRDFEQKIKHLLKKTCDE